MKKMLAPYKMAAFGLAALLLMVLAGLGFWRGMATIEAMIETVRAETIVSRDAHWAGEIARANEAALKAQIAQAAKAAAADADAQDEIADITTQLNALEAANAATSETETSASGALCRDSGGVGRDRVRLLNIP